VGVMLFARNHRTVDDFVGCVLNGGSPSQVFRIHAAMIASATRMRRLMYGTWCRAMYHLTHDPSRITALKMRASIGHPRKGPRQTLTPLVARMRLKPGERHSARGKDFQNFEGIAVALPSLEVLTTIALAKVRPTASFN